MTPTDERPIRVIAVDDDPMVIDLVRLMLKSAPDIDLVGSADDGDGAVPAVIKHRPDVVLMDIQMRRLNGIDATRMVCERPEAPRVVMMTTFDDADLVPRAMAAGAVGYTLKATARDELYSIIRAAHRGASPMSPESAAHLRAGFLSSAGAERLAARTQLARLTERELDVARLVADELTNDQIAQRLHLSTSTVKNVIASLQAKLEVSGKIGIARVIGRSQ